MSFRSGRKLNNFDVGNTPNLGWVNRSGIDEHDGNVVLDGVFAMTPRALEAFFFNERDRLPARRANQCLK